MSYHIQQWSLQTGTSSKPVSQVLRTNATPIMFTGVFQHEGRTPVQGGIRMGSSVQSALARRGPAQIVASQVKSHLRRLAVHNLNQLGRSRVPDPSSYKQEILANRGQKRCLQLTHPIVHGYWVRTGQTGLVHSNPGLVPAGARYIGLANTVYRLFFKYRYRLAFNRCKYRISVVI